jgi:hypothetical protein
VTETKHVRAPRPDTGEDWRALGFYHEPDAAHREWRFIGSPSGLRTLVRMLRSQADKADQNANPAPLAIGPFDDFQIRVWERPGIDDESIHGPPEALRRLSGLIDERLATTNPDDEFRIRDEFAGDAEYGLHFIVRSEDYDPASAMPVRMESVDVDEVAREPLLPMPAIAFRFHTSNEFMEHMGLVRLEGGELIIEYQSKDAFIGAFKSDVKIVPLPLDMISVVKFKRGMFGAKLIIQARDMKTLEGVPSVAQGRIKLQFKRDVRDEAELLASALQESIGDLV